MYLPLVNDPIKSSSYEICTNVHAGNAFMQKHTRTFFHSLSRWIVVASDYRHRRLLNALFCKPQGNNLMRRELIEIIALVRMTNGVTRPLIKSINFSVKIIECMYRCAVPFVLFPIFGFHMKRPLFKFGVSMPVGYLYFIDSNNINWIWITTTCIAGTANESNCLATNMLSAHGRFCEKGKSDGGRENLCDRRPTIKVAVQWTLASLSFSSLKGNDAK